MTNQRQTTSLLARNRLEIKRVEVPIASNDGVSSEIQWVKELTPKELVRFLFYLLDRRGFRPNKPKMAYMRGAGELLRDFTKEEVEAGMLEASRVAKHGWGFDFVRKLIGERRTDEITDNRV